MATPVQAQSSFRPPASNTSHTQNGSGPDGAVQEPDANHSSDSASIRADEQDAIREGKEKAKAVMAASGVNIASNSGDGSPSHNGKDDSPERQSQAVNGISPSRKRSRSGSRLPAPSSRQSATTPQPSIQEYLLHQYIERDSLHAAAMNDQAESSRNRMAYKLEERNYYLELRQQRHMHPGSIFGYGYAGYGNGITDHKPTRLEYPEKNKRPGNRRSRLLHIPRKERELQADQMEELVPIRLDIEFEKIKLRDTFTWNLHDRVTPTDLFAENLVEDFKLPPETALLVIQRVNHEIQEQIQDFYPHVYIEDEALDSSLPYHAYKNDEMRILIKLNITIGQHTLVDQFEWELNNPANSPEEFAKVTARELSLSGEFATAIAHSIREQCQMYTKSLYITGHPFDGRPIEDADVRESLLASPLPTVFRHMQNAKDYTPYLYELNEAELERTELSMLREQRRQKRSVNRRGGPALPDLKDRQRTVRTLVVSSVLPGAAETLDDSRLYKVSRASGRSRRATGRVDGGDETDESDDSESGVDSPAPSQVVNTGGTSRTRNMRTAASAAQVAMRANLGRSATPEITSLHHHETRTSARRSGVPEVEESVDDKLIVKLRIPKEKFKQFLQNIKNRPPVGLSTPLLGHRNVSQRSTPAASSMLPPPSPAMQQSTTPGTVGASPRAQPSNPPAAAQQQWSYYPDGRADAPYPLPAGHTPPPPPPWLATALRNLQDKYPQDLFEPLMRYNAIDKTTQQSVRLELAAGQSPPSHIKHQYLPRIRCVDCPGKLYTAGPELTVENFEVHLKNRQHRGKVEDRRRKSGG